MMHKKHLSQNNNLITMKEKINNQNAKVTVQYIQNQLFQKPYNVNNDHSLVNAAPQDDLEIENVEYLEEHHNEEDFVEERSAKNEFEDNFYPNAIHCLLDLYKIKYESIVNAGNANLNVTQVWHDIAKDMQESFFEFSAPQIQHKYGLLRAQYFAIRSKEDIGNFEYFDQLHDIYRDFGIESIVKGLNDAKVSSVFYKDEILLQPAQLEINEDHLNDLRNKEIVHKEHEFIDMVEKELQAMEDGEELDDNKEPTDSEISKKETGQTIVLNQVKSVETLIKKTPSTKRIRLDSEPCEEPPQTKAKSNEYFDYNEIVQEPFCSSTKINDFNLYHYNQEQERRHREKMSLLEKRLQMQERAFEQQQQLLQELIKRLPS